MNREQQVKLRSAIKRETDEQAILALLKDLDPDTVIVDGTLLNYAALYGKTVVAAYLLEKGADINARYEGDYTPLMAAVDNDDIEMVKLLLRHGPSINLLDHYGNTAFWKAVHQNSNGIMEILLKAKADPFVKNFSGGNAYEFAKETNLEEVVRLIEKHKIK
jgi:ankyrin repeat protein